MVIMIWVSSFWVVDSPIAMLLYNERLTWTQEYSQQNPVLIEHADTFKHN